MRTGCGPTGRVGRNAAWRMRDDGAMLRDAGPGSVSGPRPAGPSRNIALGGKAVKRPLAIVLALVGVLMLAGTAAAAPSGMTTINLRAWEGTAPVDGVRVCLARANQLIVCGDTEDGELWADSLPPGPYRAWVEPSTGYELVDISCTTFPNIPYSPCRVRGNEARLVVGKDVVAVNVNFFLTSD